MGLDLAFNRETAQKAGIVITQERRGSDDEITYALESGVDKEYLAWLSSLVTYISIPGTNMSVEDCGSSDDIVVRANKWGRVYEPLTNWLKANNIEWSEF